MAYLWKLDKLKKQRLIELQEKAEKEREAEEAEIRNQEQIEVAKISQNQVIEVERKLTETRLVEEIEKRRKEQNELEKNSAFEIRQKDLETEVKILNLDKESEYARLEKQRQVDIKRAQEKAVIIKTVSGLNAKDKQQAEVLRGALRTKDEEFNLQILEFQEFKIVN